MTAPEVGRDETTFPAADLDRRFYAFAVDRLIAWTLSALAGFAAYRLLGGSLLAGTAAVVVAAVVVGGGFSVLQGLRGFTPGKVALGLRVVHLGSGTPIGPVPAVLRSLILGLAALPTFGLGLATLAWTSVMDRDRRRRGWHDHVTGSIVVDVRPRPAEDAGTAGAAAEPRHIVNLTAMRLVPVASRAAPAPPPATRPVEQSRTPATGALRAPLGPPQRWRVTFDTGETFLVEGPVLVGRRPEPRPGEPVHRLVPLASRDMSLSKTHAQLQVGEDDALVALDRGSTNGSVVVRGGAARRLPAGQPTTLLAGDVVRLGDRTMTVTGEP